MTNQQPPDSDYNQPSLSFSDRVVEILQKPQTQIVSLVTLTAMVVGGYAGGKHLLTAIPLRVEKELEKILDRDVNFGKISSFSWNEVIIENLGIPASEKDDSFVEIDGVKINIDLFSLILHRRLWVNVIAADVTGYAQLNTLLHSKEKKPLPDSFKLPPLPIEGVINLRLTNSTMLVTPNAETKAIEVKTKGKFSLVYDNDTQPLNYQLENTINSSSSINIEGETSLGNTSSKNKLEISHLYLPEVATLIPHLPVNIQEGRVKGNLELITPSLPLFMTTQIKGNVNLEDVEGKINQGKLSKISFPLLSEDFKGNVSLNLSGNSLTITNSNFAIGNFLTTINGDIFLTGGYNLEATVKPVMISKVLPSLNIKSSILIDGLLSGNFDIKGEIDNPQILGKVRVKNSQVDKLELGEINTQFLANLDKVTVKEISIKTPNQGKIISQGVINTNFRQNLMGKKPFQVDKTPFNFRFSANLPSTELINSYNFLPKGIDIGNVVAGGEIKGNISQLGGRISFSLPNMTGKNLGIFSAQGKLVIDKNQVKLRDTKLVVNETNIQVNGSSNFQEKTWEVSAVSNDSINLTPFVNQFCQNSDNCRNFPVNVNLPIKAKNLDVSLRGNLGNRETKKNRKEERGENNNNNEFININFKNIEGEGKVNLVIDDGNLQLDTRLVNGNLVVNGNANQISVNNLLPNLPTATQIVNSQFNISGNVNELLDIDNENKKKGREKEERKRGRRGEEKSRRREEGKRKAREEEENENSNGFARINFNGIKGQGKVNLLIDDGSLQLDTRLVNGNLVVNGDANQISVNNLLPNLPTATQIVNSQFNISGNVDELLDIGNENRGNLPPSLVITADSKLRIENGLFNTVAKIDEEKTEFSADISQFSLNQIISTFQEGRQKLKGDNNFASQINVSAKTRELYQLARQPFNLNNFATINSLNLTSNFQGNLANGNFNSQAIINNGIFSLDGKTQNISLSQLLPDTKIKAKNLNANISLSSNFSELLSFAVNYIDSQSFSPLPSLNFQGKVNTNIAEGKVFLATKVSNNQWQSQINTENLNVKSLNQQLAFLHSKSNINLANVENIDSQINIKGNLPVFGEKVISFPVNLQSAVIESGKNIVNAKGKFNIVNIFTQPDVNNLQLQVTANSNLNIIPINLLSRNDNKEYFVSQGKQGVNKKEVSSLSNSKGINFLPQSINLDGKVNFQGVLTATNLLTNPLGKNNLSINGNLIVNNLNFNQLQFESLLTGKVIVNPREKIVLDLRGKEDIIAVNFVRKNLSIPSINLTLPFTPNSLEINKTGNFPFNFQGRREDNQFIASIKNFALETLQLQPVINYGIKGKIQGNLVTNFTVNLTDLTAEGDLKLDNLGIGNIIGKQFTTNFNYQNNIARLNNGQLKFGNTIYDLQGKINLVTQNIEGRINLQGNVEDILNTLRITDVATLTGLLKQWQNENFFADASAIPSQYVGKEDDSIKTKVNLLSSIDDQIRAIAKQAESGLIPNDLDITGGYRGEILLGGKLTKPEIGVNLEGNQWQWLPQQPFPNIVNALGLIMQESQAIPIQKIAVNANFKNDNLTVNPFRLNIGESQILFAGNLSPKNQEGKFQITDFPLDFITGFFPLPFDVDSLIDMEGNLAGNLLNPEIKGNLVLNNTSIDGAIIEDKINTDFTYKDYQLDIATVDSKNIKFNASLPYHPLVLTDKPALINLDLNTENITFLELFSKGQLQLSKGKISTNLSIKVALLSELFSNFNLEEVTLGGNINFEEAIINSVALNTPINLSGTVNLLEEKQAIDVSNLQAKINNTDVNISGILPLIKPLKDNENILTFNIPNQALQVKNIYSGKVDADITIDGTVLKPKIGGYVSLNNGNFTLPETKTSTSQPENKQVWKDWFGKKSASNSSVFQPELTDFTLKLDNTEANQWRFYRFLFGGEVTLNGGVLDWQNIKADGAINIRRGRIYLGGANPLTSLTSDLAVGQTTFFLSRTNKNMITFNPDENILNPDIDIELQADIIDYSRQLPTTQRNEISDPILRGGRGENIQVVLRIDGGLAQLLPVLSDDGYGVCRVPSSTPIAENIPLSSSQLGKVSQCINLAVLNKQGTNLNLLNSSLVSLSSIPNRSEGELINLIIGGQLLNLATQLQELSGEQLFENGLVQFILVPLANNISFGVNEKVSTWGKPLGMKDLRVFPLVEGVYEVKDNSNVTVSYDYIYGEFKVRYQMRF